MSISTSLTESHLQSPFCYIRRHSQIPRIRTGIYSEGPLFKRPHIASAKGLRQELVWGQVRLVETTQERTLGDETGGVVESEPLHRSESTRTVVLLTPPKSQRHKEERYVSLTSSLMWVQLIFPCLLDPPDLRVLFGVPDIHLATGGEKQWDPSRNFRPQAQKRLISLLSTLQWPEPVTWPYLDAGTIRNTAFLCAQEENESLGKHAAVHWPQHLL